MLVAAWHLSPELSHKRRKGFRAWAEPCVASIDAAEPVVGGLRRSLAPFRVAASVGRGR